MAAAAAGGGRERERERGIENGKPAEAGGEKQWRECGCISDLYK
jgi:hypothetical protein